jgi:hypothetical protein
VEAPASGPGWREGLLDPRQPLLVPLVLLIASRIFAALVIPVASEDAYITFRYARNLVAGHGLVYNPGELVMGFTSPLWALWSALGIALAGDPVAWSRGTTILADGVTLLAVAHLLRRHVSLTSAWLFGVFFAAWPYFAAVAVSGMENSVMLTVIVAAAILARGGSVWTGPALAALAVTRPEGVAVAALIAMGATWRDRLIALALFTAAAGALTAYYGSPLPQSLLAKSQLYGTPGPWSGRHWWEWVLPMALGRWPIAPDAGMMFPLAVLIAPGFVMGVRGLWRLRDTALALAATGMLLVWTGYAVLGVAYFYWYLVVPLAGVALVAAIGLPDLLRGRAVYVAAALMVLGTWSISRVLYVGRAQTEMRAFGGMADHLAATAAPGQKVMLEPIGIVGWQAPLVVIDESGLVSPAVAARRQRGDGWYTDIARDERPDWLAIRASVRGGESAFAGTGAPFRSALDRDSLFARYEQTWVSPGRGDFEVWRRVR